MPRPTKTAALVGGVVEDAIAVYDDAAGDLDVVLRQIVATHARETTRRQREVRRLTEQRDRLRSLAQQAREARALLPAGAAA